MKNRLPDLNVPARERIGWVDLLRVIACFLVVFSHSCDAFVAVFDSDRATFLQGALAGSFVRACVPLFVMMSGVLLLPVRTGTGAFYRKRIGRVLLALVFWSLTLPVLYYLYMRYVGTSSPSIDPALFTGEATLHKMWTFVFNFCYDTTPLWYLYMLIGLYLIMPLISPWLERASRRELQSVLAIWGVTLLLPYVKMLAPALGYTGNYGNTGLYGVCDWNEFGTFHYVSGFAGYLVLAFYLVKFPPAWNWRKTLGICIPTFLAGYLATGLGYVVMQKHFPGNCLPRNRLVFRRHQRLYDDRPGLHPRAEGRRTAPRMALAAGGRDVRHLSLPLHLRSGRLRPRAADSGTSRAGAHRADRLRSLRRELGGGAADAAVERDAPAGGVMRYQHSALSFNSGIRSFVKTGFLMPCRFWAV